MAMARARAFGAALGLALTAATPVFAQQALQPGGQASGELRPGDATLASGEYVDSFTVEGRAGQHIVVRMTSTALDPYLLIRGPANFKQENDDESQGVSSALLDVTLPADGRYTISATTYKAGESGAYVVTLGGASAAPSSAAVPGAIRAGDTVRGTLARGDETLQSGEYADTWRLQGRRGETFTIRLASSAFDPYLLVRGAGGLSVENDDDETARGTRDSRLAITLPADGEVRISATTYKVGEGGAYALSVQSGSGGAPVTASAPVNSSTASIALGGSLTGRLQTGDGQLRSGEFIDSYTFNGRRGQTVDVRLTSTDFDPYVMIAGPDNFSEENDDDVEEGAKNARLIVTLPADGAYTIRATSFQSGETGAYRLAVAQAATVNATTAAPIALGQTVNGVLASGDQTVGSGAFVDRYRFRGAPGQRIAIDMRSSALDSFLTLVSPSGSREQNDDAVQGSNDSRLETELAEAGDYIVVASSYGSGGTGAYQVSLATAGGSGARSTAVTTAGASSPVGTALSPGASISGRLQTGDDALGSGELFDRYTFSGRRGQTVAVEMTSGEIDSYVIVQAPSGAQQDNDDRSGASHDSRVSWVLPEDGTYSIRATTYAARESGAYTLRFLSGAAAESQATAQARRGKVFAVMVGVSDYGGANSNLAYTADDALKLAETLRRENVLAPQSVTLTNAEATPAAVRAAFQRVAAAAGPDDMFLFFYSGHGGQAPQRVAGNEPDLRDETLVLRGGSITDDEMAQMFGQVRARMSLLALDACFSGGFARDVVSRPGVMGLFSSEEDLTSAVAEKFQAGGYLSHFLRVGLSGDADTDANRIVTAGEMSTYLRRQFAAQANDVEASTQDGERNYQFLVVERGGVKIDDPMLLLP